MPYHALLLVSIMNELSSFEFVDTSGIYSLIFNNTEEEIPYNMLFERQDIFSLYSFLSTKIPIF